jgi:hypothetical protein
VNRGHPLGISRACRSTPPYVPGVTLRLRLGVTLRDLIEREGEGLRGDLRGSKAPDQEEPRKHPGQKVGNYTFAMGGRWRLRVSIEGRQATYGTYPTEDLAPDAQARWRLTHLLPADDPEQAVDLPASVAVGGVRCDEWFVRR